MKVSIVTTLYRSAPYIEEFFQRSVAAVTPVADEIEVERARDGAYASPEDLVRRVPAITLPQLEALATAGAFGCFSLDRRQALWAAGAAAQSRPGRLPGIVTGVDAPQLPGMDPATEAVADLWATGIAPYGHPTQFLRPALDAEGVLTSSALRAAEAGSRVTVAGVVTHRQRPMTAQGITFLNLEDETGLINIVVSKKCWQRFATVARTAAALVVHGRLERVGEGEHLVVNVVADKLTPLPLPAPTRSRDFR